MSMTAQWRVDSTQAKGHSGALTSPAGQLNILEKAEKAQIIELPCPMMNQTCTLCKFTVIQCYTHRDGAHIVTGLVSTVYKQIVFS